MTLPRPVRLRTAGWRRAGAWLAVGLLATAGSAPVHAFDGAPQVAVAEGTLQAAFAPWDDVEGLLVQTIGAARVQVLMQAYLLTSKKIAVALIAAGRRGVDVKLLADATQSRIDSGKVGMIAAGGVPVWLETGYQSAHNKVIIIDAATPDATVITGSFNFTWTAQHKNAENILILRKNPTLAARYALNWERHLLDATPYAVSP